MRPLILHNVPDDERYTGEDGIQRPYAMIWPEADRQRPLPRTRVREINETGSFGKSSRRSRSRTGSLPPKREDATMQSADKVFSNYLANRQQTSNSNSPPQRQTGYLSQAAAQSQEDAASAAQSSSYQKQPVEVILRGYASPSQQYAAINHYEQLAGRICEDYSREPPIEARRYKSDLRDPALTRRKPLTQSERTKVNMVASGEHWVKITFESQEAADSAIFASPQKILGHLVFAELYRNMPPIEDAAVLDIVGNVGMHDNVRATFPRGNTSRTAQTRAGRKNNATVSRAFATPLLDGGAMQVDQEQESPPESQASTQTIDTATASTATVTGIAPQETVDVEMEGTEVEANGGIYCRRIPTARRVQLKPAEDALAKQPSFGQWLMAWIPLLSWFSIAMIGDQVPRNEVGEFDMNKASLYWQFMYWLDYWFGIWGHELVSGDKDD
ncbi:hypothetical protein F4775DRAFT_41061 [Biscogniauxia sp. FL1348]|nr:hypothetical protein F4775DRAFT_41061 [Biscogniauxia sp. FL1348]